MRDILTFFIIFVPKLNYFYTTNHLKQAVLS